MEFSDFDLILRQEVKAKEKKTPQQTLAATLEAGAGTRRPSQFQAFLNRGAKSCKSTPAEAEACQTEAESKV